jgi:hypothetical protein
MGVGKNKMTAARMYEECRFIKSNGLKCQSPAMRGCLFCYFHAQLHGFCYGHGGHSHADGELSIYNLSHLRGSPHYPSTPLPPQPTESKAKKPSPPLQTISSNSLQWFQAEEVSMRLGGAVRPG